MVCRAIKKTLTETLTMRIKHDTVKDACIYKMKTSKKWYLEYYIEINGKRQRKQKAAKTENKQEAMRKLDEVLLVARLVEEGRIDLKESNIKTVKLLCKKVIKDLEKREYQKVIFKDYIRKLKDISNLYENTDIKKLDKKELKRFFNKPFSNTQLRISRKAFRLLFEYAQENNFIQVIPDFPSCEIKKKKEKEDYEDNQVLLLIDRFKRLSTESKNQVAKENFLILSVFIRQLFNTGMRYGEARNLKRDCIIEYKGKSFYRIDSSKVSTAKRKIMVDVFTVMNLENLTNKNNNRKFLFERIDGKLPDFGQIFQGDKLRNIKWYKEKGLEDFTLYNIRDCFIKRKIEEGKDLFYISQHCGTSITMIEKHYAMYLVNRKYENIYESQDEQMEEFLKYQG